MRKLGKTLAVLVTISVLSIVVVLTQTRVSSISRLLLYRVTIPSAQRALCAAKRKVHPDFGAGSSASVCETLGLSTILRATRLQLENGSQPLINDLKDDSETAAEIVAKAHARLHLLEKITFMGSTIPEDKDLIGENLLPRKVFGQKAPSLNECLGLDVDAPGLTSSQPEEDATNPDASPRLRMYLLQGFGLANVGVIESTSGLVLIDTAESSGNLQQALRQLARTSGFRTCTKKYIIAALISHHHTDHIGGLKGIENYNSDVAAERGDGPPANVKIIAHESTIELYTETFLQHPQAKYRRGLKQFGSSEYLSIASVTPEMNHHPPSVISAGIGHTLGHIDGAGGVTYPTHQWSGSSATLYLDGAKIEMRLLPGETTDQVCFFIPDLKLLHVSDNFYFAFPNIYPLRGGVFRSPMIWVSSLDILLKEYVPQIEAMSTGHTNPVLGRDNVKHLLQRYRDSIQFVHDQTIRLMNRIQDPDAIARGVADLFWTTFPKPQSLSIDDVLSDPAMPFYGQVHWAAKAVVFRERGWFGGKDVEINSHKLPQAQRYARLTHLVEGSQPISSAVLDALSSGDCQWALELATMVLKADEGEPETSDPAACPSIEDENVWLESGKAQGMSHSTALELREVYSDWRSRICQRLKSNHRSSANFDDPWQHGQKSFSKGAAAQKQRPVDESDNICPSLQAMNSITISTLKARSLFLCLRREALWCLARRELPSSGRNWYLVEALTERQKANEEISHFRVAHRIRQDFLQSVPDLPAVVKNFPERFEPGIISFDNVGFWINLVRSKSEEGEDTRYIENPPILKPVRSPPRATLEVIARNQILIVREIPDRDKAEKPDVEEFVDIWMTFDALRSVLLKQYPAGPVRLFMLGDIWFDSGDWKRRLRHFCHYLEILLAIEHE